MSFDSDKRFRNPPVSQKVKRMSSAYSPCNIRNSDAPVALQTPSTIHLFKSVRGGVSAPRSESAASGALRGVNALTSLTIGNTAVALNSEEVDGVVREVLKRVQRQDASDEQVTIAQQATEKLKRLRPQRTFSFSFARDRRSNQGLSPRASFSVSPRSRGGRNVLRGEDDRAVLLLFPFVVAKLEQRLKEARDRIMERMRQKSFLNASLFRRLSLMKKAFGRWQQMNRALLIGRRAALHRMMKKWQIFSHNRIRMRKGFYSTLFHVIDKHRLHRVLCAWYIASLCHKAASQRIDPYTFMSLRPASMQLAKTRPDIVYTTLDALLRTVAKTAKMGEAISHHKLKIVRPLWDAWRCYVLRRRQKHNNNHLLRLYLSGKAKQQKILQCFRKWAFRTNVVQSLSVFIFNTQRRAFLLWHHKAVVAQEDDLRLAEFERGKRKHLGRYCLKLWRSRAQEESILALEGTTVVLENRLKLLPFAIAMSSLVDQSNLEHKPVEVQQQHEEWSRVSIRYVMCFRQWRGVVSRRRRLSAIERQQHRLYCKVLLRRAFFVWKTKDSFWDSTNLMSTFAFGPVSKGIASDPLQAVDGGMLAPHLSHRDAVLSAQSVPSVTLFGPDVEAIGIPWTSLRAVERYCRRSYNALNTAQMQFSYVPSSFFTVDTFCPSGKYLSTPTLQIADRLLDEEKATNYHWALDSRTLKMALLRERSFSMVPSCDTQGDLSTAASSALHSVSSEALPGADSVQRSPPRGFQTFLLRRMIQGIFVFGRLIIACRHASRRMMEFRSLMFDKHLVMTRERAREIEELLVTDRSSSPTSSRLSSIGSASDAVARDFASGNRLDYKQSAPLAADMRDWVPAPLVTESEKLCEELTDALTAKRDILFKQSRRKLLVDAPNQILIRLTKLGFPAIDRTLVEQYLDEIASFLNQWIANMVRLRVAFRMRSAFFMKRCALIYAAAAYRECMGLCVAYEKTVPTTTRNAREVFVPHPPLGRSANARDGVGLRSIVTASGSVASPTKFFKDRKASAVGKTDRKSSVWRGGSGSNDGSSSAGSSKRSSSQRSSRSNKAMKTLSIDTELLALDVAVKWRWKAKFRRLAGVFSASSIVCIVPPKVVLHTVSRSSNAPDKLLRSAVTLASAQVGSKPRPNAAEVPASAKQQHGSLLRIDSGVNKLTVSSPAPTPSASARTSPNSHSLMADHSIVMVPSMLC